MMTQKGQGNSKIKKKLSPNVKLSQEEPQTQNTLSKKLAVRSQRHSSVESLESYDSENVVKQMNQGI